MNSTPRLPTATNSRGHPPEFEQLIIEKSQNFVGREFVFAALKEFLHQCDRGYFTLIGAPGSGKSAILAQYVTSHPQVVYYNAQVEGKNQPDEFLSTVCTQLMGSWESGVGSRDVVVPDNATQGSWFLSLLLQKISDQLEPDQRLMIAIDALDAIAPNSQSPGSNLLYLPRYLPPRVYFLLTRRPFLREKSGLLIETPSQTLDLGDYPEQNREDVQTYIKRSNLKSWLTTHNISDQDFSDRLTTQSQNNFMYLSQIIMAIAQGGCTAESIAQSFSSKPFQFYRLPPSLETYYQSHWQRMAQSADLSAPSPPSDSLLVARKGQPDRSKALAVLNILVQQEPPLSTEAIAQLLDEDEYEVEEVLESWIEFLQRQRIGGTIHYSLYHPSFRDWLARRLNLTIIRNS